MGETRLIIWEYGVGNAHVLERCGIAIYSIDVERKRRSFMMPVVSADKYQGVPFLPAADFTKVLAWCIRFGGVNLPCSLLSKRNKNDGERKDDRKKILPLAQ